jgi:LPS export ABC transporter protein LptC
MRRAQRLFVLALVLAVVAVLTVLVWPPGPNVPARSGSEASDVVVRTYNAAGDLTWEVTAEEGMLEGEEALLVRPLVEFFEADRLLFQAEGAELQVSPVFAELRGGVTASRAGEYELTTDAMRWTNESEMLTANETTIRFDRGEVQGERFRFEPRTGRAALEGRVTGTVDLHTPATVRCQRAEWTSDEPLVLIDVEIDQGETRYTASRAETSPASESVVLIGEAQVHLPEGRLRAERITVDATGFAASGGVTVTLDQGFFAPGEDDA